MLNYSYGISARPRTHSSTPEHQSRFSFKSQTAKMIGEGCLRNPSHQELHSNEVLCTMHNEELAGFYP